MKKVIFPTLLIAASLVFFSFKPIDKTLGTAKNVVKKPSAIGGCYTKNKTDVTFSECNEISTTLDRTSQASILNKY